MSSADHTNTTNTDHFFFFFFLFFFLKKICILFLTPFDVEMLFYQQRIGLIINQRKQRQREFVKNVHTNKKSPELGNIPPNLKKTPILSNILVLDSLCAQRVAHTQVQ